MATRSSRRIRWFLSSARRIAAVVGILGPTQERAEAVWLSSQYNPAAAQWLKDLSGNGHHLRLGSSGRAAVLDGALVLPGVATSYASTPDHAELDITGDIELVAHVALDDWTPASASVGVLIAKDATGQRAYRLSISSGGGIELLWFQGGAARTVVSSTSVSAVDGASLWVKATLDVNNGSGGHAVNFYTSPDGTTWTPLGSANRSAGAFTTSIDATTAELRIGGEQNDNAANAGRIHRAIIKNGIDGTTVFDADFSELSDGTPWFNEATGKRVTVKPDRAAVVDGALYLPGISGQYAQSPDHADLDITSDIDIITKVALDDWTPADNQSVVAKWNPSTSAFSYVVTVVASTGVIRFAFRDSTNALSPTADSTVAPTVDNGAPLWIRITRVAATGEVTFYTSSDGTTWAQLGAPVVVASGSMFSSSSVLALGALSSGTQNLFAGRIHRAIIKNGIDGTTVFDADFSTWSDGDGMGGFPKKESTGKYVSVLSDTTGNDTNDPKWLAYEAGATDCKAKGLYLPGISGNYASVPDEAALDITGDITIDTELALDDWTPSAASTVVSKYLSSAAGAYEITVTTTGLLRLSWGDGASTNNVDSTAAVAAVDGQRLWVRATLDVDGNTGGLGYRVKFFTSSDGTTWTQLGGDVTGGSAPTAIAANGTALAIGARAGGTAQLCAGRFFRARIYNGYFDGATQGGSAVLDIDFADATEPFASFVCDSGQTVTINRASSGRKSTVVDRPMFLFGTDDYMALGGAHAAFDIAAGDSFSVAIAKRRHDSSTAQYYMSKKSNASDASAGWRLGVNNTNNDFLGIADGVAGVSSGVVAPPDGLAHVTVGVRNTSADNVSVTVDGNAGTTSTDTTTGSLTSTSPVEVGRLPAGANVDMVFTGAGVWREALTGADVTALDGEYGTDE